MSDTFRTPEVNESARRTLVSTMTKAEWPDLFRRVSMASTRLGPWGGQLVAGSADPDSDVGPGHRIKHYEIIRELGRGGMACVFIARDLRLGRKVALKFVRTESPAFTARFLVEARATARCEHENIVVIHEVDEVGGRPYMVLELLDGQPLSHLLAAGQVSAARAVEFVIPVAKALVHAHSLGIIHRDLKPENIFLTSRGIIKVLDFGIAKFSATAHAAAGERSATSLAPGAEARWSGLVGTLPYMAPEQWSAGEIDHRVDIWAVGILLWQLAAGRHPLDPLSRETLFEMALSLAQPMPSIAAAEPSLSPEFARVVDRCLAKDKRQRYENAGELLDALAGMGPGRGVVVPRHEGPYLGLRAFRESDAGRFFGRTRDIIGLLEMLPEQPLIGVVGPSGVGKSSFVQAGVVPALRSSGEPWEVFTVRPGRGPLASLASLLSRLPSAGESSAVPLGDRAERLRREPGCVGEALRRHADERRARILVFVDQFEELYTQVSDSSERSAFLACLAGAADDRESPVRVVMALRSDFIDRVAEDRGFLDQLARGFVFLPPADRDCLREAILQPLEAVGYRFEEPRIVEDMIDSLRGAPGALPLLQFAASRLWEARDRYRQLLTRDSYDAIGGVAGALAGHADRVLSRMAPRTQRVTRDIFQRLVTAERTRASVPIAELTSLHDDRRDVDIAIALLVDARLLITQGGGEGTEAVVEIVHESLIQSWPTLRRWLDEKHEDSAFLENVRAAARHWDSHRRPTWLLWTGDTADEATRFARRYKGELAAVDRAYLEAVVERVTQTIHRRRRAVMSAFAVLLALVVAAGVALVRIDRAERDAREQQRLAETEAIRARTAEQAVNEQLTRVNDKEAARQREERRRESAERESANALLDALRARTEVEQGKERLARANRQLELAADRARKEAERATKLAASERKVSAELQIRLEQERESVRQLQALEQTMTTVLK